MKFSVIVPIYNVEEYLERCIGSVLEQTFNDYELLLVNDGSPDNSAEICRKYLKNGKVKYFEKENGGLGDARNYGIERAKGEYLVFIDSDDYVEKELLESVNNIIDKYKSDIVIFDYMLVDMQDELMYVERQKLEANTVLNVKSNKELLLLEPAAWNKVYKRQLFIENDFRYPSRVWYEDLRTTAKVLSSAERIVYIDKAFYHYFQRPGSIMNNKNLKRNLEIIDAVEDIRQYFNFRFPSQYTQEIEFLAVWKVLVDTSGRIMSIGYDKNVIGQVYSYVKNTFPDFRHNTYLKKGERLNKKQKIIYFFMCRKAYRLLRMIFLLRHIKG